MIIVKLRGGLGNQMFQYALGRHLAERTQTDLLLDPHNLNAPEENLTPRAYELDLFPRLRAQLITKSKAKALRRSVPYTVWYTEGKFGFYSEVFERLSIPAIGLDGYWQSERYFDQVSSIVRQEFTFDTQLPESDIYGAIGSSESVCVHVRRGDYVDPIGAHLGFVGLEYYIRAIATLERYATNLSYFVFSNDIQWCRENMSFLENCTFVESPFEERPALSLRVMSHCQHFIIANSSFSWWAAWLSSNPRKIVIAPSRWFAREEPTASVSGHQFTSKDIVPESWMRV